LKLEKMGFVRRINGGSNVSRYEWTTHGAAFFMSQGWVI